MLLPGFDQLFVDRVGRLRFSARLGASLSDTVLFEVLVDFDVCFLAMFEGVGGCWEVFHGFREDSIFVRLLKENAW